MPKTSKKSKKSSSSADQDLTQATIAQLARLTAEVLRHTLHPTAASTAATTSTATTTAGTATTTAGTATTTAGTATTAATTATTAAGTAVTASSTTTATTTAGAATTAAQLQQIQPQLQQVQPPLQQLQHQLQPVQLPPQQLQQLQLPHYTAQQLSVPVPTQLQQQILRGEYVDFSVLLDKASFVDTTHTTQHSMHKPPPISSFPMWMQAWNTYLTVILTHNPARALELVGYQRIITSTSQSLPLKAWFRYDSQSRTMAASNPHLRWDQRLPDLWHETVTSTTNTNTQHWPCPYCGAKNYFPTTSFTRPFVTARNALDHLIAENPDLQYAVTITMDSAQETHAPISTSACLARASTPVSPVQTGDQLPTNSEAMPSHAYTTYTTTLEHTPCTEVIGYTRTKLHNTPHAVAV